MIKKFKLFESHSEIDKICRKYGISNYTINSDGSISVDGDVDLVSEQLTELPLNFGTVKGHFYCEDNGLKSLKGSPSYVGGDFGCHSNRLTSLQGAPSHVSGYFDCHNNQLASLEGCPSYVGGGYYCSNNKLISLEDAPEYIGGDFYCGDNPVYEIYSLFNTPKCIEWINEYDVIQNKNIIRQRLEEVYAELNIQAPNVFNFKYYTLVD